MDHEPAPFDWIGWLATIPGIPAGWGDCPSASAASLPLDPAALFADELPELKAA